MILTEPLTTLAFAPFGDVLDASGEPDKIINQGLCGRYHDKARLDFGPGGRAGVSIFKAQACPLPFQLDLLERHPEGSQTFIPMTADPFLVIVAGDDNGTPVQIRAFMTSLGQGVNLLRNTWHGVLTPLTTPGLFAVIDRIGDTANLQEFRMTIPMLVARSVG